MHLCRNTSLRVLLQGLRHRISVVFTCLVLGAWVPTAIGQTGVQEGDPALISRLRMTEFFQFPVGPSGLQFSPSLRQAQGI